METKIRGYRIRSRIPYMEEGEGDISHYAELEKIKGRKI